MEATPSITLICVRHGETSWNEIGKLQGQTDIPLNDRGRRQAELAGLYLAKQPTDAGSMIAACSSDLERAAETAKLILKELSPPLPLHLDERLRETHLGDWQGRTWAEIEEDAESKPAATAFRNDADFCAPGEGGESFRKRFARVVAGLHRAAFRGLLFAARSSDARGAAGSAEEREPQQAPPRVLVVSHGGALDDLARLVKKTPFSHGTGLRKANAALHLVSFKPHWGKIRRLLRGADAGDDSCTRGPLSLEDCERAVFLAFEDPEKARALEPADAAVALGEWELVQWGIKDHLLEEEGLYPGAPHGLSSSSSSSVAVRAEGDIITGSSSTSSSDSAGEVKEEAEVESMATPKPV